MIDFYAHLFACALFIIGLIGLIRHHSNLIILLMCLELMLLGVNTNFIAFSRAQQNLDGQFIVLFVMTIAAAEVAIALALIVKIFRDKKDVALTSLEHMRG